MATKNDTPIDKDKDVLMEVRGIIDGCLDSGSKEYKNALSQIARVIDGDTGIVKRSHMNGGLLHTLVTYKR